MFLEHKLKFYNIPNTDLSGQEEEETPQVESFPPLFLGLSDFLLVHQRF